MFSEQISLVVSRSDIINLLYCLIFYRFSFVDYLTLNDMYVFLEMNVPSPVHDDNDNGEQTFIDESDIINEYEIDDEGTIVLLVETLSTL